MRWLTILILVILPLGGTHARAQEARLAQSGLVSTDLRRRVGRLEDRLAEVEAELTALRARQQAAQRILDEAQTPIILRDRRAEPGEPQVAPAIFVLDADPRGGPRSTALSMDEIGRRCGDADGCLATLAIAGFVEERRPFEAALGLGPCLLHYDPVSGDWAVAASCDTPGGDEPLGRRGRNGDGSPLAPEPQGARTLLDFAGACLLAEAPPTRFRTSGGAPALAATTARDLYLLATSADWHLGERFPAGLLPSGARFECRLTLRD